MPFTDEDAKGKTWHCKSTAKTISEQKLESLLTKSLSEKLINPVGLWQWTSPDLIMPSLFSTGASRGLGIPTCVKGGVTHWKRWFWVKLALITFIATSTTGVDSSAICTNTLMFFGQILSLFGVVVEWLGERFILQDKVATLIRWGGPSFYY